MTHFSSAGSSQAQQHVPSANSETAHFRTVFSADVPKMHSPNSGCGYHQKNHRLQSHCPGPQRLQRCKNYSRGSNSTTRKCVSKTSLFPHAYANSTAAFCHKNCSHHCEPKGF